MQKLDNLASTKIRTDFPEFKSGDRVIVKSKITEGTKERVQAFEGVCISRKGSGIAATCTIRRVTNGVGVERIFALSSPSLVSIERKVEGFVRRSKIYYIRDLDGRAARIQDLNLKLQEAQAVSGQGA
jgi:large subunit ribosomal protein L19